MPKYSYEFKKKVVMAYLNGEGVEVYLTSKFNIASPKNIKMWVKSYLAFGKESLKCSRKKFCSRVILIK